MLHKAATSFSPFKLQHLHAHVRSALNNLNYNSNSWQSATSNSTAGGATSSSSTCSTSSSTLGSSASNAGGSAGSAKWHAGRSSYGSYVSAIPLGDLLEVYPGGNCPRLIRYRASKQADWTLAFLPLALALAPALARGVIYTLTVPRPKQQRTSSECHSFIGWQWTEQGR